MDGGRNGLQTWCRREADGRKSSPGAIKMARSARIAAALLALASCDKPETLPITAGMGPNPTLPPPYYEVFPPIKIAPPIGWSNGEAPIPAPDLKVSAFAAGLN